MSAAQPSPAPSLRVVRGRPTDEETAAVVAALVVASGTGTGTGTGSGGPREPRRSLWTTRSRYARPTLSTGPGAWRASTMPR